MIKLIASDMDGTLFNSNQEISPLNIAAIKQAEKQNVEFMIATGRSLDTIGAIAKEYQLNCSFLLLNGAEIRDKDKNIISTANIEYDILPRLYDTLVEMGYVPEFMTGQNTQICGSEETMYRNMGYRMLCLDRSHTLTLEEAIEKGKTSVFMKNMVRNDSLEDMMEKNLPIRKMIVFSPDLEQNARNREILTAQFPELFISYSYPDNIEINARQAQKGHGLLQAIEKMGIQKEEVAVFGDGLNDLSMFELFPNSFAPVNAEYDIKKLAKEVIPSNNEDGVGKKIFELLYKNKEEEVGR